MIANDKEWINGLNNLTTGVRSRISDIISERDTLRRELEAAREDINGLKGALTLQAETSAKLSSMMSQKGADLAAATENLKEARMLMQETVDSFHAFLARMEKDPAWPTWIPLSPATEKPENAAQGEAIKR